MSCHVPCARATCPPPGADLLRHLPAAISFMDDAHSSGGKVLVHCVAGMSRSVSLVLAYLVQREPRMRLAEALRLVKQKRTVVSPNPCFMEQLARFEVRRSEKKKGSLS